MDGDLPHRRHGSAAPISQMNGNLPTNQPHTDRQDKLIHHNGINSQLYPTQCHVPRTLNILATSPQASDDTQKHIRSEENNQAKAQYDYYYTGKDCAPCAEMLRTRSKEEIAAGHLHEIDNRVVSALALRRQTHKLCPDIREHQVPAGSPNLEAAGKVEPHPLLVATPSWLLSRSRSNMLSKTMPL